MPRRLQDAPLSDPDRSLSGRGATSRVRLGFELGGLFIVLPVLAFFEPFPFPKLPSLILVTLYCVLVLTRDPAWSWRPRIDMGPRETRALVIRLCVTASLIVILARILTPGTFLLFPREHPGIWVMVLCGYPFLSALPQEIIYRAFFFHRYRAFFPGTWSMVAASALCFAFVHIVYDNVPAPALSLIGGVLFATTYRTTGSLLITTGEHALYGLLVFTAGLGRFFYEGF